MIEINQVSKKFGDIVALDHVSLRLESGSIIGLLGPNGAGKTTLMRVMTGYLSPTVGTVSINNLSPLENPIEIKKQYGYLPEGNPLYGDMKTQNYLQFIASLKALGKEEQEKAVSKVIDSCGLRSVCEQKIETLSKGYRQRVGLAQALIGEPPVLILDEPTSGLDPNQVSDIRNLIKEIGKERTVILSTHILSEVQSTCNQVVLISQGKVIISGPLSELQRNKNTKQTAKLMIKGTSDDIQQILKNQSWVENTESLSHDEGETSILIHSNLEEGTPERIFALAKEKGWVVVGLESIAKSMEESFRELTQ